MELRNDDFKRILSEEDQSLAYALASALRTDDVEAFLQIYDQIPANISQEKLGNIKEMARQVAALTRTTNTYRHSPIPAKDLPFFGNSHPLQACQLSVNGPLAANDFSAFKTPPEGRTPVDIKQFDYEEETLKSLETNNPQEQLGAVCNSESQLNDSGVLPDNVSCTEKMPKTIDRDNAKIDDDAFHTPPEFQDDSSPSSSEQLITRVIDILSKTPPDNTEETIVRDTEDTSNFLKTIPDDNSTEPEEALVCVEGALSEKDSLDSSPVGSRRFTQEEDDSGISTVDENDVSRDSPTAPNNDTSFADKKLSKDKSNKRTPSGNNSPKFEKRTSWNREPETKQGRNYMQESIEDTVGWQTRHNRRPARKRDDHSTDHADYGHHNEQSNFNDYPRRPYRNAGRFKERNARTENHVSNTSGDRLSEDCQPSKNRPAWSNNGSTRENDDNYDINEKAVFTGKRNSKRNGWNMSYGGKKTENNKWMKNGTKEKFNEIKNRKEQDLENNTSAVQAMQPATFSYRDALLKASSSKDSSNPCPLMSAAAKDEMTFDANAAASYLSSAWTRVLDLHRKDPSKVFIFSDD